MTQGDCGSLSGEESSDLFHKNLKNPMISLPIQTPVKKRKKLNIPIERRRNFRPGETSAVTLGSLTVEAALAVPAFLLFCGILLTLFLNLKAQIAAVYGLDTEAKQLAAACLPGEEGPEDIVLTRTVSGGWLPDCTLQAVRKAWTGRFLTDAGALRYVIVTENASVYHLTEACTYLSLSVRLVKREEVEHLRNADGAKYYPCERCAKGPGGEGCYITRIGRRYHLDRNCSGLKRSWRWVPAENCGLPPCSRCGGS